MTARKPLSAVEQDLVLFGFSYHIVAKDVYPLSHLAHGVDAQIRYVNNAHDKDRALRMVENTKAGAALPPILVAGTGEGHVLLDGNGRVQAYLIMDLQTAPHGAIVVELDWDDASDEERAQLRLIAATANTTGPMPLTKEETLERVLEAITVVGASDTQLAVRFGLAAGAISRIRGDMKAEAAFKVASLTEKNVPFVSGAVKRTLVTGKHAITEDRVLHDAALLINDVRMRPSEVVDLTKELAGLGSETARVNTIAFKRVAFAPDIRTATITSKRAKTSPQGELRRALGAVLALGVKNTARQLVERGTKSEEQLDMLRKCSALIDQIMEATKR